MAGPNINLAQQAAIAESDRKARRTQTDESLAPLLDRMATLEGELSAQSEQLASARQRIDATTAWLDGLRAALNAAQQQSQQLVGNKSAGGPVGQAVAADRYVSGLPIATGSVLFTFQAADPDGWIPCDGTEHRASSFPELYAVIGVTFGAPALSADNFKVPTEAQLGGKLHAAGRWMIRT